MILSDADIRLYLDSKKLVIDQISDDTIRENGVDLRIGDEISRFVDTDSPVDVSKKEELPKLYKLEKVEKSFVLGKNERVLVKIKEKITLPDDLVGFCNIRSTFVRLGMSIPPTIADAGFSGYLTILLTGGPVPVVIERDTRMLHLVFSRTNSKVNQPYAGKYQNSTGVTGAKDINLNKRK